jgi:flavin reductase (DIM6/NTAB) family NADH-FMN oxidoreductase RutF
MASSEQHAGVDPDLSLRMRDALRRYARAVVVVTCVHDGTRYAMAATACSELSLNPPSLLICINKSASIHSPLAGGATRFCINILSSSHQTIAAFCSGKVKGEARFEEGDWAADDTGTPFLRDAQASFFCDLDGKLEYGTHVMFIGRIGSVVTHGPVDPLVYVNGKYSHSSLSRTAA